MVSKGTQDLLVNLGIVVLVIVIIYVVIIRNPNALNWLKGPGKKTGAVQVGSNTATGPHVYQTAASSCGCSDPSEQERCGVRSSDMDCQCELDSLEATAIIQYGFHSSCDLGTEFDIKMGGPIHDGGNCCWWLFAINVDDL